jgi:hypothetical protein
VLLSGQLGSARRAADGLLVLLITVARQLSDLNPYLR